MYKSLLLSTMVSLSFIFTGCGGGGNSTDTNQAPTATPQTITMDEDTTKAITLTGTDPDGDALTYTVTTPPTHGTFENGVYTPTANYHGSDSFSFTANDGSLTSAPAIVSITVTANCKPLPKTGQTTVYTNFDDGHYQKGASVDPRFVRDDVTQTVKDNVTGLVWQDDEEVQTTIRTWQGAIDHCEALELGTFTNWRLPTIEELVYITDKFRIRPAIDPVFQNIVSDYYWSSTTLASYTSYAWVVYFYGGYDYYNFKTYGGYVRCVRDGQ